MANVSLLVISRALLTSIGLLVFLFQYLMGQLQIQAIEMVSYVTLVGWFVEGYLCFCGMQHKYCLPILNILYVHATETHGPDGYSLGAV